MNSLLKTLFPLQKKLSSNSFYMGTLDVDSLFTNIPLEETNSICRKSIYDRNDSVEGLNKSEFKKLLSLATK